MAINEKSRNLYQPSPLTRDLADQVRAFGVAQRFQRIRENWNIGDPVTYRREPGITTWVYELNGGASHRANHDRY